MAIIDTIKGLSNLVKDIGDIELNSKIIDLQNEVYGLIDENHELKEENRKLKGIADTNEKLTFKDNMYYITHNNDEKGPYCTVCWDVREKLVRMHETGLGFICDYCFSKKNR